MKIIEILDGILNQLIPLIRSLMKKFTKTPIEKEKEIEHDNRNELDEAKKSGRPKW